MIEHLFITEAEKPSSYLTDDQWCAISTALNLTQRQLWMIKYTFDGLNEQAIGQKLGVSVNTVHARFTRLYRKLDVHNRTGFITKIFIAHLSCERRIKFTIIPQSNEHHDLYPIKMLPI